MKGKLALIRAALTGAMGSKDYLFTVLQPARDALRHVERDLTFGELLESTRDLQTQSFGADPSELDGDEFAEYIRNMTLAAQVELSEFIQELPWKPWRAPNTRPDEIARERAVEELIDVVHFLANLFVALNVDASEIRESYEAKRAENVRRQAEWYDHETAVAALDDDLCLNVGAAVAESVASTIARAESLEADAREAYKADAGPDWPAIVPGSIPER